MFTQVVLYCQWIESLSGWYVDRLNSKEFVAISTTRRRAERFTTYDQELADNNSDCESLIIFPKTGSNSGGERILKKNNMVLEQCAMLP